MNRDRILRIAGILFLVLLVNTAYVAAFASPTIFYMTNVLVHLGLGLVLTFILLYFIRAIPIAGGLFLVSAAAALYLTVRGNITEHRWALWVHVLAAALGLAIPSSLQARIDELVD